MQDGAELTVGALDGELGDSLLDRRIPIDGSISGDVMTTQRTERLTSARDRLRFAMAEQLSVESGLFVPLVFRGRALGVLNVFDRTDDGDFTREHEQLLEGFAASAATAVATAQTVESEGLRRSIEASERERQRWAHELHDETLQELAALKVVLSGARRSRDLAVVQRTLDTAIEQIDTEITSLRRMIADLRPATLDAFGAKAALEGLAERVMGTSGLEIDLDVDLAFESGRVAERKTSEIESTLYRIVQEALTNVVKHAEASAVEISVVEDDERIAIVVRDDGRGFDAGQPHDGFGLLGMRERVQLVRGELRVTSASGAGTTVEVTIPVAASGP